MLVLLLLAVVLVAVVVVVEVAVLFLYTHEYLNIGFPSSGRHARHSMIRSIDSLTEG